MWGLFAGFCFYLCLGFEGLFVSFGFAGVGFGLSCLPGGGRVAKIRF